MRRAIVSLVLAVAGLATAFAQVPSSIGANFVYGSKFNQVGVGVDYKQKVGRNIRIAPEFQYFFENKGVKAWDANLNVQYVSTIFEDLRFYPMAGLTFSRWMAQGADGVNRLGANIGWGFEYNFDCNLAIVLEVRGQLVKDYTQCVLSTGVKYNF